VTVAATVATIDGFAMISLTWFAEALGSGPRGRWFKSTRPDQFSENLRKSAEFSLAVCFDAPIGSRDPSAPYFKRWPSEELFVIIDGFRAQTFTLTLRAALHDVYLCIGSCRVLC